jgi:hypothetical protein
MQEPYKKHTEHNIKDNVAQSHKEKKVNKCYNCQNTVKNTKD